jgi:hypothetical protein
MVLFCGEEVVSVCWWEGDVKEDGTATWIWGREKGMSRNEIDERWDERNMRNEVENEAVGH